MDPYERALRILHNAVTLGEYIPAVAKAIREAENDALERAAAAVEVVRQEWYNQRRFTDDLQRNWFGGGAASCEKAIDEIRKLKGN